MGEKEPFEDRSTTDGICNYCMEAEMTATEIKPDPIHVGLVEATFMEILARRNLEDILFQSTGAEKPRC